MTNTHKLKKCEQCENEVPEFGQCNKCGFLDKPRNVPPLKEDFIAAREVNSKAKYKQYRNFDMVVLDVTDEKKQ